MRSKQHYEEAPEYAADGYAIAGYPGIAWTVRGWETEPDEDTAWSGYETRTGNLVCVMVGDDRRFSVEPNDVSAIDPESYCRECGQIGCGCCVYS